MKMIRTFLAVAVLGLAPLVAQAASHTVVPVPVSESSMGITYHLDWSSLAAAAADSGTAYFDLREIGRRLDPVMGVASTGAPTVTVGLMATFGTNIDSCRVELAWGVNSTLTAYGKTNALTNDGYLLTRTTPFKTATVTPPAPGSLRLYMTNKDATTAGLIDLYVTFIKRNQ